MDKFLTLVGLTVVGILLLAGISVLGAYPTKWVVNYLFSATFLTFVFGVTKLNFGTALALNFITATLFKGTTSVKT